MPATAAHALSPPASALRATYSFGVQPLGSARTLWKRYDPLIDCVNASLSGVAIQLESALTPEVYDTKLHAGKLDVILIEPHVVLNAERLGYRVFVQTGHQDRIGGVIVVHRGAGIHKVRDLRRHVICLPTPEALASTMLVNMWLREASFDLDRQARVLYTGSDANALHTVYQRGADAAAVSWDGWENFAAANPEAAADLEAKWKTDTLSGPALMVHERVPPPDIELLTKAFAGLSDSERGRAALQTAGFSLFRPAGSAPYDDVWEFVGRIPAIL